MIFLFEFSTSFLLVKELEETLIVASLELTLNWTLLDANLFSSDIFIGLPTLGIFIDREPERELTTFGLHTFLKASYSLGQRHFKLCRPSKLLGPESTIKYNG